MKVKLPSSEVLVPVAVGLALVALALMVSSVLSPSPLLVVAAMSVGQVIGTMSLVLYGLVILRDLRRARVLEER